MKMFTEGERDDTYKWIWLDNLQWPQNTPCAFYGLGDDVLPSSSNPSKCW
jgi:hypothetical protein